MLSEETKSVGSHAGLLAKKSKGTLMQDVARTAQMSVGNLYQYFPSRPALVEALIIRHFAEIVGELETIASRPDPTAAFLAVLRGRIVERHVSDRTLSAEIAAGVVKTPELATIVAKRMEGITWSLDGIIGSACDPDEAGALKSAHAVLLIAHGAMTSPPVHGWGDERITDLSCGCLIT